MSEAPQESPQIHRYESPTHIPWEQTDTTGFEALASFLKYKGLLLPEPLIAFRGGGIVAPKTTDLAPGYRRFLAADRSMAVIPLKSEADGRLTDVVHFPKNQEGALRFDANLAAYKKHVGDYVHEHWDTASYGPSPLPKVSSIDRMGDGCYVTVDRYRPYLRDVGKGSGALSIHELDTQKISVDDMRRLVHVLDAAHPRLTEFHAWMAQNGRTAPPESCLHPDHKLTALRGQEWWIQPNAKSDRIRELSEKIAFLKEELAAIDPDFDPKKSLEAMIKNNLPIFPHQNGTTDSPEAAKQLAVVHGALYPGNIHLSQTRDRSQSFFTITGGDRSHIGLPAESVDWLITASAASPAHQEALISEFLALHPSAYEKRGLAMHTLYRAIAESSWFAAGNKPLELKNLAKLTYDILNGNNIWEGVNTPAVQTPQ